MIGEEFDYVVIGAGTAGCVLANRLSEDGVTRVALLEAGGGDSHPFIAMPAAFAYAISNDQFGWGYHSDAEPHLGGRRIPCPRGRVLGGSSSINAMAFVRGQAADYDSWAASGLPEWDYAACLPYFKRLENFSDGADAYRGGDGPVHVTRPRYSSPLNQRFLDACAEVGHKVGIDTNGASQEGFGPMEQTIHRGRRVSAAAAYLRPARRRANLVVRKSAMVDRIVFEGKRAVGAEYRRGGQVQRITARAEVILCAGAINSPQILMLSGIGDGSHLAELDIPLVVDRPDVGRNLQDHVDVSFKQSCPLPVTMTPMLSLRRKVPAFFAWTLLKKGPCSTNHFEVAGYIRSSKAANRPDIQLCFIPLLVHYDGGAVGGGHGYQVTVMALQPRSRGWVRLRSADPRAAPGIAFNYLKEEADIVPLRNGIYRLREIMAQPALDALRGRELAPGADVVCEAELDAFIRATGKSTHHPCGTCRMGSDEESVVDAAGRVRGVDRLRVIDASIMPTITSGNINAPVFMLAEKLSDAIRGRAPLAAEPRP